MSSRFSGLPEAAIATSNPASIAILAMTGPTCPAPRTAIRCTDDGITRHSPSTVLGLGNQIRLEMVLQRSQDVGERRKLLRRQRIGEMPLDRPHVWRGGPPEDARALGGQGDLGSPTVSGA